MTLVAIAESDSPRRIDPDLLTLLMPFTHRPESRDVVEFRFNV